MVDINQIIKLFFKTWEIELQTENDTVFELRLKSIGIKVPSIDSLKDVIQSLPARDVLNITITILEDTNTFTSVKTKNETFLEKLIEYTDTEEEEVTCSIIINKNKIDKVISVYDFDQFSSQLKKLSITQCLSIFKRALGKDERIFFEVPSEELFIETDSFIFCGSNKIPYYQGSTSNRTGKLDKLKQTSHFSDINDYPFTPDDFKIRDSSADNYIVSLFHQLCFTYSIIYLFDISSLNENHLHFKINGYKSISGSYDLKDPLPNINDQYFSIYSWAFNGGNLNDKIGLARNIISLHFESPGGVLLKGDPYQSIQSGYKVYEKQNIKQYIEVRNKITDQLIDFNNRANKIIETFATGFQKSALALITFYFSAFAIKALGSGEFLKAFTIDATILSFALLAGSFMYFRVSKWEVVEQRKRFINSYNNMKLRYTDLLDEADIKKILNNDKEFNEDLNFINEKLKMYSNLWISLMVILLVATLILYFIYSIQKIFGFCFVKIFCFFYC